MLKTLKMLGTMSAIRVSYQPRFLTIRKLGMSVTGKGIINVAR